MKEEREIRLSMEEFEAALKKANLVTSKEALYTVHIEPGELVIEVLR